MFLTLSAMEYRKACGNTCGKCLGLAKFGLIKMFDELYLIATETKVCAVLYTNSCGLTKRKVTLQISMSKLTLMVKLAILSNITVTCLCPSNSMAGNSVLA